MEIGVRESVRDAIGIAVPNASSSLPLPPRIEAALIARRSEICAALDDAMRAILAETLGVHDQARGGFDESDWTAERRRTAAEIDRARVELAALQERVATARRELDEVERRRAEAEESYQSLRRRIETERANRLNADRIADESETGSSITKTAAARSDFGAAPETTPARSDLDGAPDSLPRDGASGADECHETTLVVNDLPHLAEALRVRKTLRGLEGVRSVSFPRFQNGTMTVVVGHAPGLDLIAAFRALPDPGPGDVSVEVSGDVES